MTETIKFQIDSSFYANVVSVCDKELTNCPCKVRINENEIEVPLLLALTSFSCLTNEINSDITQREFSIDVDFNQRPDNTFFDTLVSILYGRSVSLRPEDVINLGFLGERVNNRYFLTPYEEQLRTLESTLSLDNCFDLLSKKHTFHIDTSQCTKEITLISENFESQKTKLIDISKDVTYISIISSILSSSSLKLEDEDSLLEFVLSLCSIDREYESLFEHVHLEYCSVVSIQTFVDYLDTNVDTSQHVRSIIRCISRRLLEPSLPKSPNFETNRHNKQEPIHPNKQEITDSDPLKGILYREHQQGNVVLDASAKGGDIYNLVKADPNLNFNTGNSPNSWIQASLKDNKPFLLRKYMIRGNKNSRNGNHLRTWKLEGKKESNGEWIVLDTHSNEPFDKLLTKVFPVSCNETLTAVKLTQTDTELSGTYYLHINAFDIFGSY